MRTERSFRRVFRLFPDLFFRFDDVHPIVDIDDDAAETVIAMNESVEQRFAQGLHDPIWNTVRLLEKISLQSHFEDFSPRLFSRTNFSLRLFLRFPIRRRFVRLRLAPPVF